MSTRGTISLVFDDGYQKVFENVLPILNKHNIPGVFAIPLNGEGLEKNEQRKIKPWEEWLPIKEQGHEIAAHSVNHVNLTTLEAAELEQELHQPIEKLGASTIIYPGGALDDAVVEAASKMYKAGRTVHYGFEKIPPKEPMYLKSYNFSRNNFSIFKANRLALWAWLTNSWLIETYHMVDDHDRAMVHTVKTKEFASHVKFLKSLPVAVRTIEDVTVSV